MHANEGELDEESLRKLRKEWAELQKIAGSSYVLSPDAEGKDGAHQLSKDQNQQFDVAWRCVGGFSSLFGDPGDKNERLNGWEMRVNDCEVELWLFGEQESSSLASTLSAKNEERIEKGKEIDQPKERIRSWSFARTTVDLKREEWMKLLNQQRHSVMPDSESEKEKEKDKEDELMREIMKQATIKREKRETIRKITRAKEMKWRQARPRYTTSPPPLVVGVLGDSGKGKSWVVSRLLSMSYPPEVHVPTEGLTFFSAGKSLRGSNWIIIDTPGFGAGVPGK